MMSPKEDKSPINGYVLIMVEDGPRGGADYWFCNNLEELIKEVIPEWDDRIKYSSPTLARFTYDQKPDYIEGILPLGDEAIGKVNLDLYPRVETADDYKSVHYCFFCDTFKRKSGDCLHCQEKLFLASDGTVYFYEN